MLLTAFVLVLGFVALSGMVARMAQLPEETRQSTDRPIFTEAEAVAHGVQMMMQRVDELNAVDEDHLPTAEECNATVTSDCYVRLYAALAADGASHLERLESARGFRLRFADPPVTCDDNGGLGPVTFSATYTLNDVNTRIEFTSTYTLEDAADGPTDADFNPTPYRSC